MYVYICIIYILPIKRQRALGWVDDDDDDGMYGMMIQPRRGGQRERESAGPHHHCGTHSDYYY